MTIFVARTASRRSGVRGGVLTAHALWRLLVLAGIFGLFLLLIIGRLTTLALFESTRAFGATTTDYIPDRGDILDRNGVPLARTIQAYSIWVKPDKILGNKKQLAKELTAIFPDTPESSFYQKLTSKKQGYLRQRALPAEVRRVHDLGEIAIEFPREAERLYPQHELAAHAIGFLDRDGKGALGIERMLDAELRDPAKRGKPVSLAIDIRVQGALEIELARGMEDTDAKGAAGVILDAQTGEVLAMATLPAFDPNRPLFTKKTEQTLQPGSNLTDRIPIERQVNSVTNQVYELGSTFKPLTVAAALDAGSVRNLAIRYDATVPLEIGGFKIRDLHPTKRWLNVPETLVHSSNIVTARIADNLGPEGMAKMLRDIGFHEKPAIEIGERAKPIWPRNWGRITNMTVGYGHGIAVTPMHLANAYAAMVNGGIWRPATLIKVAGDRKHLERRVFSASTSARMRQLLRMIVVDGTGKNADAAGYRVGGKTGSAEKPSDGSYSRSLLVATFAAAFPMDNPRYVMVAMLDEPKGAAASGFQRTAGLTAAPIIKKTVTRIGPLLGIIPDIKRDVDVSELTPLLWTPKGGG